MDGRFFLPDSLCTTRLRQWCHTHAEEGLLDSESPGQHVALTPKFDQQLLANFLLFGLLAAWQREQDWRQASWCWIC